MGGAGGRAGWFGGDRSRCSAALLMYGVCLSASNPTFKTMVLPAWPDLVGAGLGPVFVAFFIERLGRVGAFNLSTAGWIPCGLLLLGTGGLAAVRSAAASGSWVCRAPAGPPLLCILPAPHTPNTPITPPMPAAGTLATDEKAMQLRLHKVISSYSLSSSAASLAARIDPGGGGRGGELEDPPNGDDGDRVQQWQPQRQPLGLQFSALQNGSSRAQ